ncbi:MAG TPA: hypothetical protein VGQ38_15370 [Gaiellaceae bacterium]|jgi:hypothetical protein|nr:hypothetical protein [Gaiellaceae bacterium]
MSNVSLQQVVDFSTFPPGGAPFDHTNRRVRGPRAVLEWVMRAWLTPTGSLPWARNRGFDILGLENGDFTLTDLYNIKAALESEARQVMFVRVAQVAISLANGLMRIDAQITLVDGGTYPLAVTLDLAAKALGESLPLGQILSINFGKAAA